MIWVENSMDYDVALMKLLQIPQLGAQRIARLLAEIDLVQFCEYDRSQLQQIGWNSKQIQRWFHPDMHWIEEALAWREQNDCHIISLFAPNYPFLLRQISTPPPLLFVKGNVNSLSYPQIAIVGSRDYSHYGEYWATFFSRGLVKSKIAITSGLAIGIDGFCHQGAIDEKGITIAVLGSGLAHIYPTRHRKLAESIVDSGGALVSEFFPQQPPLAEHFPRRNRIISGLSLGTLVIEATLNSGSLITARYALEQGREVFALPNVIQNPHSQGCHKLIKEGALLVESVEDILNAISLQYQPAAQLKFFSEDISMQAVRSEDNFTHLVANQHAKSQFNLSACQQKIIEPIGLEAINPDDIAKASGYAIEVVLVELVNLELLGAIKSVQGGYVVAN